MKKLISILSVFAAMLIAAPASAAVWTYTSGSSIGQIDITIDTTAQTATLTGPNINIVMTDSDLATWDPVNTAGVPVVADSITGTYTVGGTTYNATLLSDPNQNAFCFSGPALTCSLQLFGISLAGDAKNDFVTKWYPTPTSSSGTPVPAPGMMALFGLGLGAVGLYCRRKKVA